MALLSCKSRNYEQDSKSDQVQMDNDKTAKDLLYNPEFLERFDPSLLLWVKHGFLHSGANVTQITTRRWIFRNMGSFRSICSSFALPGCECSYKVKICVNYDGDAGYFDISTGSNWSAGGKAGQEYLSTHNRSLSRRPSHRV
jgi:hypothetical protein